MLQFDLHRVRVVGAYVRHQCDCAQCLAVDTDPPHARRKDVCAARLVVVPGVGSDHPNITTGGQHDPKREELAALTEHLLRKREGRIEQAIEVVLNLRGC